ncbi:acetyl-CoA carboxylase biotin carboxylase subunit [Butyricicoccus faecihominis]|uniref:acetyl-CoA carboxylase biotin carboxylase subunit n=1 Tax=Butyricicoccaceae TaxID=3085642 RepID=UPI00247AAC1C|nr:MULTISPECIES: acetyl-CoA carboxylase biotin carboxylase subunit [Butyricicoccaceae]MCQ5129700.1 acetyl-CoA carboxylase biotin carboxylase subunit [Butyricicoccus faecihominis]WNX85412.1 acetyl-CoA carboxylase biotin carboxylase subunit [Agathobaculum sp. NTUH-O15-33]
MFQKVLIANRGEIAVRIIQACRDLGIVSVAVYSEADREALHAQIADEAVCIGPAGAAGSYLNMDNIISAAIASGCQAIHPGFGFLSENPDFAEKTTEAGLAFIGPTAATIRLMGDKAEAKRNAIEAGVPVALGTDGTVADFDEAVREAARIGFPIMLKAASGGGGKGIRIAMDPSELQAAYDNASSEAEANFGDGRLYMERYIHNPRHIEVQILGDQFGNVVHLFERECSVQRRHQKLIEESPSAFVDDELRARMTKAAVDLAKRVGYRNAGTIEFLVDNDKNFYFCEMNTRIQVEHPVTEQVTGVDLVCEQIRVAAGEPLSFTQEELTLRGHAIECRINAEDPSRDFAPCPGAIVSMHLPGGPGVRMDTAAYQGYRIPPYYDSMIGKLIAYGADRRQAIARMRRALTETLFEGVVTGTDYQMHILRSKAFEDAAFHVNSIADGDFDR